MQTSLTPGVTPATADVACICRSMDGPDAQVHNTMSHNISHYKCANFRIGNSWGNRRHVSSGSQSEWRTKMALGVYNSLSQEESVRNRLTTTYGCSFFLGGFRNTSKP